MIEAPAGLGKSRLIAELRQRPTLASMGFLEARDSMLRNSVSFHVSPRIQERMREYEAERQKLDNQVAVVQTLIRMKNKKPKNL